MVPVPTRREWQLLVRSDAVHVPPPPLGEWLRSVVMQEGGFQHQQVDAVADGERPRLLFSGFVHPCRYLEVHNGVLGFNVFREYPGAESWHDVTKVVDEFCTLPSTPVDGVEEFYLPSWLQGLERQRAKYRLGTGDCHAGLRSGSWNHGANVAEVFDDFNVLAEHLVMAGVHVTGFLVNLGAADGIWSDPLREYTAKGATGVAVEMDPERCRAYRRNFPRVRLLCMRVTPDTLSLVAAQVPIGGYDVVKVDIDSYDCEVVWTLLQRFRHRPSCVLLEVNPTFPPPFEFSVLYDPAWHVLNATRSPLRLGLAYGCSLSYAVRMLTENLDEPRYVLLQMSKKDALFLRNDIAEKLLGSRSPPDEFECYQASLVETRAVEPSRLRKWFFGQDLQSALAEMRALVRADLALLLGEPGGLEAPFVLSVGSPSAKGACGAKEAPNEIVSMGMVIRARSRFGVVSDAGRHYLVFRDLAQVAKNVRACA